MSKPPDRHQTAKKRAQKRGRWAETLTSLYLRLTGHRILAHNFKTPVGEIDLIAKRGKLVRFIEVKSRTNTVQALEAVSASQRGRIQRAAEAFLIHHPMLQTCDIRFDVCVVTGWLRLSMVRDAWRP